jgi:DNA-binding CsgD family transcriptional regulator
VRDSDLTALLDVIAAGQDCDDVGVGLPTGVLECAFRLVPCDAVGFFEFDVDTGEAFIDQDYPTVLSYDAVDEGAFWRNYYTDRHCCYPTVSGDDRSITTISDFYSASELHRTAMYNDCMLPLGVERELMMCFPTPITNRSRRLLFARGPGREFDDRDRLLLTLLRPHLHELYQDVERRRHAVPDLTPRQWQLLRLVAAGHSNAEIAHHTCVSTGTVRKHLENIFNRLQVTTRTAAVARAFPHPV